MQIKKATFHGLSYLARVTADRARITQPTRENIGLGIGTDPSMTKLDGTYVLKEYILHDGNRYREVVQKRTDTHIFLALHDVKRNEPYARSMWDSWEMEKRIAEKQTAA